MKNIQQGIFAMMVSILFVACSTSSDPKTVLSNQETRKEIMNTIAADSAMHREMMMTMLTNPDEKVMMQHHTAMMEGMKSNPEVMKKMMHHMMEMCKTDSTMMDGMCKEMMSSPEMMDHMKHMKDMPTHKHK